MAQTHRVHIAIVTNPELHFTAGPTFESMRRYAFNPGCAVELNNAAKHSVENRGEMSRVHMILDWVDPETVPHLPPPQQLTAGQHIRQIRGRVEVVETEEEVANPLATKQMKKDYMRQHGIAGTIAAKLAGEGAKQALLVGKPAVLRKWHIQHYDASEFWAAVLDLVSHGCENPDEGLAPVSDEEREELTEALAAAFEGMAAATDTVMAAEFRAAVAAWKAGPAEEQPPSDMPMTPREAADGGGKRMREADTSEEESAAAAAAGPPPPQCSSVAECVAAAAAADQSTWPSAPRFIILGVQKCGTTTLWDHLAQHPRATRAQKREPHFFDWNWQLCQPGEKSAESRSLNFPEKLLVQARKSIADVEPTLAGGAEESFEVEGTGEVVALSRCELQARYLALFRIKELALLTGDKVVGESTPSYLFYGKPV